MAKKPQKTPKKGPKSRKISQNCQKFHNFRAKTRKKGENSKLALFETFGSRIKKVSKCDISAPGRPTDLRHHSKRSELNFLSFYYCTLRPNFFKKAKKCLSVRMTKYNSTRFGRITALSSSNYGHSHDQPARPPRPHRAEMGQDFHRISRLSQNSLDSERLFRRKTAELALQKLFAFVGTREK